MRLWRYAILLLLPLSAAADVKTLYWQAVTQNANDVVLTADKVVDRYGVGCSNSQADVLAAEGDSSKYVYTESTSALTLTHDFPVGDWFCLVYAHNVDGWSARSNLLSFTVAPPVVVPPPPPPAVPPKAVTGFSVR